VRERERENSGGFWGMGWLPRVKLRA
jgi:hypothetical protein